MLAHAGTTVLPVSKALIAYAGVFLVLITTAGVRASLAGADPSPPRTQDDDGSASPPAWSLALVVARVVGLASFAFVLAVAITGPDTPAGNLAPVTVLSLWWVALPLTAALAGDVMRAIGPFDTLAAVARIPWRAERSAPAWASGIAIGAIAWYLLGYHSPTDPRSLAIALVAYTCGVLAGAARWGRAWLAEGEAFGVLSRACAGLIRGRRPALLPATTVVACIWVGTTVFEALLATRLWLDIEGTRTGWSLTLVDTAGLIWVVAMVAAAHTIAIDGLARLGDLRRATAEACLVAVPVLVGLGYVVAHEGPNLVIHVQNALALISDPFGRGWDLFGTIDRPADYGILSPVAEGRLQLAVLAVTHVGAVLLAASALRGGAGRDAAMRLVWVPAAEVAVAIVSGVLLLVGGGNPG